MNNLKLSELVDNACRATELFNVDELETFAEQTRINKGLNTLDANCLSCLRYDSFDGCMKNLKVVVLKGLCKSIMKKR